MAVESKNGGNDRRKLDPISFRPWEDNYLYLEKIGNETGQPIGELCRDIFDEGVQARLNPLTQQLRDLGERYVELVKKYEQIVEQESKLKQGLIAQLRKFGGVLSEALASAIGARRLVWNYVAYEVLKTLGYQESKIKERLEAENKAWNAERDDTVKQVNQIIAENLPTSE
jgi:hypothetical protein